MKKLVLASAALIAVGMSAPATAADMPVKYVPPAVFSWTGCYVGVNVGYATGHSKHRYVSNPDGTVTPALAGADITPRFSESGLLAGGQVGCNYQVGIWVWGVEVDGQFTDKDGQAYDLAPLFNPAFVSQTSERWFGTARLRLGYAWDKSMVYVTGGGAWAGVQTTEWNSATPAIHNQSNVTTVSGYTVGVGWEYALGYGWSIKSEYLYANYGWKGYAGTTVPATIYNREVYLDNHIFRWGMNYKFDIGKGKGPVVAKY